MIKLSKQELLDCHNGICNSIRKDYELYGETMYSDEKNNNLVWIKLRIQRYIKLRNKLSKYISILNNGGLNEI